LKLSLSKAIFICLAATAGQAALATPDSAAVLQAKQIREDVQAKQQQLAEEQRVQTPAPAAPGAPLELPIDETDSPGATK
jgi:hypothetical protein